MSSYYASFSYTAPNGKRYNSFKDKNLLVVHFESGDSGEMDTFLGMDCVYADNAYRTKRFDYGARYNSVAKIRISVMKADGLDFTVSEVRDFLRWTTGSRQATYLDLSDIVQADDNIEEIVRASFYGRITSVYQQKLDARTIGFVIEHTSNSPYCYSPIQNISCYLKPGLTVDKNGILVSRESNPMLDNDGVLNSGSESMFGVTNDGTLYLMNYTSVQINNESDDLSDYVYMDTVLTSNGDNYLVIKNQTLYDESDGNDGVTEIDNMQSGEVVTLHSGQFITSSSNRLLNNDFNFVWPKLMPGINSFVIGSIGEGNVYFKYRYPIKIGDCAMDVNVHGGGLCGCDDYGDGDISGPITWSDIIGKPNTISGYEITDAYTKYEVDNKIKNVDITIDEDELNDVFKDILE